MKKFHIQTLALLLAASFSAHSEDVIWQALNPSINISTTLPVVGAGSTLTKVAGVVTAFNTDAVSVQRLSGDGYVEFRFDQTSKRMAAGLCAVNTDRNYTALDYGIVANMTTAGALSAGTMFIREGAANVTITGTFLLTDVFRIERVGTIITYKKGATVLRTSTVPSLGTLMLDTSFEDLGSISGCKITATGKEEDILWDQVVTATASYLTPDLGSKLTHSATAGAQGAVAQKRITGDGYVKFKIPVTAKDVSIGFSTSNPDNAVASVGYAIQATGTTTSYRVLDPTHPVATPLFSGTFAATDIFTLERIAGVVKYYKNSVLVATSAVASSGSVFVDASMVTASGTLDGCRYGAALDAAQRVLWTETEKVVWNAGTGVTAANVSGFGRLTKSGATTLWDAGSTSAKSIERAGTLSFRFGQTDKIMAVGLSAADGGITNTTIQFGLHALGNGTVRVSESGTLQGTAQSFVVGDVFSVARANQVITYARNGVVFYTSTMAGGTTPLLVDSSFLSPTGFIEDARIVGEPVDIIWHDLTFTAGTYPTLGVGSTLSTATGALATLNADGVGKDQIVADGFVRFQASQVNRDFTVGLAKDDSGTGSVFPYAIHFGAAGSFTIEEAGVVVRTASSYVAADVFRIERRNGAIYYYQGATPLRGPIAGGTGTLFVDTAFATAFATGVTSLGAAQIYLAPADSDADGIADAWEYQYFASLDSATQSGGPGFLSDYDHDGYSNLAEFLSVNHTDPKDYYNGVLPNLVKLSGDAQFSPVGAVLPLPLVIEVRDTVIPTNVLLDAPVSFSIQSGGGLMGLSATGPFNASILSLRSNTTNGQAQVWYQQPNTNGTTSIIRATATSGVTSTFKDFSLYTHHLLGYWKLDDSAGTTTMADSSPVTPVAPGTLLGSPTRPTGLGVSGLLNSADLAVSFNGTSQYVSIPHATKLQFAGAAFSISAWVQLPTDLVLTAATNIYPIAAKWLPTGTGFELVLKGGAGNGLAFRMMTNGAVAQELVPTADQRAKLLDGFPHYVVFTRGLANDGKLYVDGALVGSLAGMSASLSNTSPLLLGKNNAATAQYFKGTLDEVKVLASTFNAPEIAADYTGFDSDADGLPNSWELRYFGSLTLASSRLGDNDTGGADGLTNGAEYLLGTNPNAKDTDGDQMGDGFEVTYGFAPLLKNGQSNQDGDVDGLTNLQEYLAGTNPTLADTDGDWMNDGFEVLYGLNPLLNNGVNGERAGDLDGDGLTNFQEYQAMTNPVVADTDGDGLWDGEEVTLLMNPKVAANPDTTGQFVQLTLFTHSN